MFFRAVHGEHHHETACAENDADGNIMDKVKLRRIESTATDANVRQMSHSLVFDMAAGNPNSAKATIISKNEMLFDI